MRDVTALRRALRQLETQWALVGGAVADEALAQHAATMQAQMEILAERLRSSAGAGGDENDEGGADRDGGGGEEEEGERQPQPQRRQRQQPDEQELEEADVSVGVDWLPSRSASVPSLVTGIRAGARGVGGGRGRKAMATTGRSTLAAFNAVEHASRELQGVLEGAGSPFPGDLDYRRPRTAAAQPVRQSVAGAGRAAASTTTPGRTSAASASASASFLSPGGAAPMQVEERTPAGFPSPFQARGGRAAAGTTSSGSEGEAGGRQSPRAGGTVSSSSGRSSGRSSRASGGPRRVLASAPEAAPLYDETAGKKPLGGGSLDSSSAAASGAAGEGGAGPSGSPVRGAAGGGGGGIRDQLAAIRNRIVELDDRAARLAGLSP